jgi:hypothetical protein
MPKSEYIIHGTQTKNLIKILHDGYIDNDPDKKYMAMLGEWGKTKQIFAQLIYKDIPNEKDLMNVSKDNITKESKVKIPSKKEYFNLNSAL